MKNIVIIGHAPAAHAAILAILARDPSTAITLISCDGNLPYDRMLLPGLIDRSVAEKNIYCAPVDFYQSARIQLVLDKELARINFDRKRVFTVEAPGAGRGPGARLQVDYDGLIIMDAPEIRLPTLKGVRRQGVFHLARLESVRSLIRYLALTKTVVIEFSGFAGVRAALALRAAGKEVIVAVRQDRLLPDILDEDRAGMLVRGLGARGVRLLPSGGGITDIIGEAEVKAVRFASGKVVACDMVVLEDVSADLRFLDDAAVGVSGRMVVDDAFRTSFADVFAIDAVCQADQLKLIGGYGADTMAGCAQALTAVAGLCDEATGLPGSGFGQRDMLDAFFHPQELNPFCQEVVL